MHQESELIIDVMTGLFTGDYAMDVLRRAVRKSHRSRFDQSPHTWKIHSIGIILANIYELNKPHQTYGHAPTDQIIIDVAEVVQSLAQSGEMASRYGSNTFLLIIPNVSAEEVTQRAEQLRQAAAQIRIVFDGEPREPIALSIGTANYPLPPNSYTKLSGAEALMRAADEDLARDRARNAKEMAK